MFIDTHTHIYLEQFEEDLEDCIQRSKESKVDKLFLPNIDTSTWKKVQACVNDYPDMCYPMLGLHPCSVNENVDQELSAISKLIEANSIIAVGEIGLDYYWSKDFLDQQIEAFRIQINWAKKANLPIVIHSRDSLDDCIRIVDEEKEEQLSGIFHCFSGTTKQAEEIMELGFYIGLGGVITFKNAKLDDMLKELPLDRIVLETDAPYLTPHPFRGKRNEPSYIPLIAKKIAEVKRISLEEIAKVTSKNALEVYQIDQ